jgi:hypothetical protein
MNSVNSGSCDDSSGDGSGACTADEQCHRGSCVDGNCYCVLLSHGPYCLNPLPCNPEFAYHLKIHGLVFGIAFALIFCYCVFRLIRVNVKRKSIKFWENWQLKDTVVVVSIFASGIRAIELLIDPYDLNDTFDLGITAESIMANVPIVLLIMGYLQISLLWYRIYRLAHGNQKPVRTYRVITWVTIAVAFPLLLALAMLSRDSNAKIYGVCYSAVLVLVITPALIFTTITGIFTLNFLRHSPLAPIFRRSVWQIAGGLVGLGSALVVIILTLIGYTMASERSEPLIWLKYTDTWRICEIVVLFCFLWVVSFASDRPVSQSVSSVDTDKNPMESSSSEVSHTHSSSRKEEPEDEESSDVSSTSVSRDSPSDEESEESAYYSSA